MMRQLTILCLALLGATAFAEEKKENADLFARGRVWTFHLSISAKEWDAIQPTGGRMGFGPPGFNPNPVPEKKEESKDDEGRDTKTSAFGMTFPYGRGTLEFEGNTWKDVGVRFKGNSTYTSSSRGLKRPFKLDFNRYVSGQVFGGGHSTLNLQNDAMDNSHLRQALAYDLFRQAGIPSPRTAFVQLYLTIPGKHDKQYLGLYTLIEEVNKGFLKRHYDSSKGLLLKPERIQGLPYLGDDWNSYADRYRPKTEASAEQRKRIIAFTKLVEKAGDESFAKQIASYLDIDEFLRFIAVNVLISNLDSFIGLGHNYYMHLDAKTKKVQFLPWDLDLSFGGFPMAGSAGDQANLSVMKPVMGRNRLIERLLAIPEYQKAYREHLKKLTATAFKPEKMHADIDVLEKAIAKAVNDEPKQAPGGGFGPPRMGGFGQALALKPFVSKRVESVLAQLDGKSEGFVPARGGFGFPGGGPGGFGPGMMLVRPILENADANKDGKLSLKESLAGAKKLFDELNRDKRESLDEKTLTAALERLFPPPPGFGGPGGGPGGPGGGPGGPGGGPGGRPRFPSMASMLAGPVLKRADANKDGKVSKDEFIAAVKELFKECDKNKDGNLDDRELGEGLGKLMPAPAFGPGGPGFGPGGPGGPGGGPGGPGGRPSSDPGSRPGREGERP